MKPRPFWASLILGVCLLAAVWFLFHKEPPTAPAPVPATVAAGDQEVAFLNPATSGTVWERLVAGLRHLESRMQPGQWEIDTSQAYPKATADLPAIAVRRKGKPGTLWVRWYKLTGQNSIPVWLDALTRRDPPPLAVLGGGSSDRAKELAERLQALRTEGRETPVLLLTTATAEYVDPTPDNPPPLMGIYDQRTFRFCFSNRQMARATLEFLTGSHLLPPDPGLICFLSWKDDPFTQDLASQFRELLWEKHSGVFLQIEIPHSIGALTEPNAGERKAVRKLLEELRRIPPEKHVLLVMPGGAVPVRRVLRDLFRTAPNEARRIVVAVGDAIDFNTIVRDRSLSWKIQDVPCPLVLFTHRNPTSVRAEPRWKQLGAIGSSAPSPAGMKEPPPPPEGETHIFPPVIPPLEGGALHDSPPSVPAASGKEPRDLCSTQDLLLYADIGYALVQTAFTEHGTIAQPGQLAERLLKVKDSQERPMFHTGPPTSPHDTETMAGNRRYEAAKFIVLLQPVRDEGQILPNADLLLFQQDARGCHQKGQLRLSYEDNGDTVGEGPSP